MLKLRGKGRPWWTREEDEILLREASKVPAQSWNAIAEHLPRRNAQSCQSRWHVHVKVRSIDELHDPQILGAGNNGLRLTHRRRVQDRDTEDASAGDQSNKGSDIHNLEGSEGAAATTTRSVRYSQQVHSHEHNGSEDQKADDQTKRPQTTGSRSSMASAIQPKDTHTHAIDLADSDLSSLSNHSSSVAEDDTVAATPTAVRRGRSFGAPPLLPWTAKELIRLIELRGEQWNSSRLDWKVIATEMPPRTAVGCQRYWIKLCSVCKSLLESLVQMNANTGFVVKDVKGGLLETWERDEKERLMHLLATGKNFQSIEEEISSQPRDSIQLMLNKIFAGRIELRRRKLKERRRHTTANNINKPDVRYPRTSSDDDEAEDDHHEVNSKVIGSSRLTEPALAEDSAPTNAGDDEYPNDQAIEADEAPVFFDEADQGSLTARVNTEVNTIEPPAGDLLTNPGLTLEDLFPGLTDAKHEADYDDVKPDPISIKLEDDESIAGESSHQVKRKAIAVRSDSESEAEITHRRRKEALARRLKRVKEEHELKRQEYEIRKMQREMNDWEREMGAWEEK